MATHVHAKYALPQAKECSTRGKIPTPIILEANNNIEIANDASVINIVPIPIDCRSYPHQDPMDRHIPQTTPLYYTSHIRDQSTEHTTRDADPSVNASPVTGGYQATKSTALRMRTSGCFKNDLIMTNTEPLPLGLQLGPLGVRLNDYVHVEDTVLYTCYRNRAVRTLPEDLIIKSCTRSSSSGGVFTMTYLPIGICFGPYEGTIINQREEAQQMGYVG
jgi:hypothetical protein